MELTTLAIVQSKLAILVKTSGLELMTMHLIEQVRGEMLDGFHEHKSVRKFMSNSAVTIWWCPG